MSVTKNISLNREIPVRYDVDVFVAGGGPAGIAASVATARQGRKVYLAEGHSCLGGMGTAGLVPIFCQFADGVNFLAAGIGREIYDRLFAMGGTGPDEKPDNPSCMAGIRAEVLKRLYDALLTDAGVDFTFHTQLIGVEVRDGNIEYAIIAAKSGIFAVKAHTFIDCTGDGDMAQMAGAPFEKGDEDGSMMPGTLCAAWAGIDWDAVFASGLGAGASRLEEAFRDKVFTIEDLHLPGIWRVGRNAGGANVGHTFGVDGTDERSLTKALVWGRKLVLEYEKYYKEYLKGFEKMEVVATGSLLGLRETRRIIGDYVLNVDDFKKRAVFDDEIGRYCYPVDIHPSKPGDKDEYAKFEKEFREEFRYKTGESYGIPYRTLVPETLSNCLVAGRCISCDRKIQGSVRVMPGCFITGQAAGVAAAIAAERKLDTRSVDIAELQTRLKAMGAYLPNC